MKKKSRVRRVITASVRSQPTSKLPARQGEQEKSFSGFAKDRVPRSQWRLRGALPEERDRRPLDHHAGGGL